MASKFLDLSSNKVNIDNNKITIDTRGLHLQDDTEYQLIIPNNVVDYKFKTKEKKRFLTGTFEIDFNSYNTPLELKNNIRNSPWLVYDNLDSCQVLTGTNETYKLWKLGDTSSEVLPLLVIETAFLSFINLELYIDSPTTLNDIVSLTAESTLSNSYLSDYIRVQRTGTSSITDVSKFNGIDETTEQVTYHTTSILNSQLIEVVTSENSFSQYSEAEELYFYAPATNGTDQFNNIYLSKLILHYAQ